MSAPKIALPRRPHTGWHNFDIGPRQEDCKAALPFYYSTRATRYHRVKSVTLFYEWANDEKTERVISHAAVHMWCGQTGFLFSKKHPQCGVFANPPENISSCATCEGRAMGAKQIAPCCDKMAKAIFSPRGPIGGLTT